MGLPYGNSQLAMTDLQECELKLTFISESCVFLQQRKERTLLHYNTTPYFTIIPAKIIKDQMPNDQIPNYTVHTQYISIRSTS